MAPGWRHGLATGPAFSPAGRDASHTAPDLAVSTSAGYWYWPFYQNVWLVRFPPMMTTNPIGTIGANGTLVATHPSGPVLAPNESRIRQMQAVFRDVQGAWVLGPPSELLVLDEQF